MGIGEERIFSDRIVLRERVSLDDVNRFAVKRSLRKIGEFPAEPDSLKSREIMWSLDRITIMHYIEDAISGNRCVSFSGKRHERIERLESYAAHELSSWRKAEIIDSYDHAEGADELVPATLLVGIGSSNSFDEVAFSRVCRAMEDPDTAVRQAGIWATSYAAWLEYGPHLRVIAQRDPDIDRRNQAQFVLSMRYAEGDE
ncbi:MAG TPA: hypothetical protein VMG38_24975 [Trebonia sp.]|nr:hypothetical protein [Trebonia sp.]